MAAIKPTILDIGLKGDGSTYLVTWTPVTESDTCNLASFPGFADKSVHVYGTFGSASVAIHGSNNSGASFAALNDPTGTVIAITTEKIKAVLEDTQQFKPVITGGTGQSLSIAMLVRLTNPLRQ